MGDMRVVGHEASCLTCHETFCPDDEADLIHLSRADGSTCNGQGVLIGSWGYPSSYRRTPNGSSRGASVHTQGPAPIDPGASGGGILTIVQTGVSDRPDKGSILETPGPVCVNPKHDHVGRDDCGDAIMGETMRCDACFSTMHRPASGSDPHAGPASCTLRHSACVPHHLDNDERPSRRRAPWAPLP